MTRPWRTNIGLRLTADLGAWVEARCQRENRTLANYVETLILRDRERFDVEAERQATLSDEDEVQTVETWFDRFDRLRCAGRYAEAHAMLCAPAPDLKASPTPEPATAEPRLPALPAGAQDVKNPK